MRLRQFRVFMACVLIAPTLALVSSVPGRADNGVGDLDPTFGGSPAGVRRIDVNVLDTAYATAVDGQGRVVTAGRANDWNATGTDPRDRDRIGVTRQLASGDLDQTFHGD